MILLWLVTVAAFLMFAASDVSIGVRYGVLLIGIVGFVLTTIVSYRTKS